MEFFYSIVIFTFGLVIGSFLNTVIYRLAFTPKVGSDGLWKKKSFLKGRSFCPKCYHVLAWYDLIPLLSFLILRGRCRYCGKKISIQYPLVEMATGLIFLLIFNFQFSIFNKFSIFNFQFLFSTFYLLIISSFLIIIFVYDLKHYIILDKIIYPAIAIAFLYNLILNSPVRNAFGVADAGRQFIIHNSIFAALGAAAFFFLIWLLSHGKWMGIGDIKLVFFMGLLLGFPEILIALFFAFLIGAIIGIGLILAKRKTLKSEVPFGPFLITGTFIALFWGEGIINWYLNIFNYLSI